MANGTSDDGGSLVVNISYDNTTNVNDKYVIVSGIVNLSIYDLNQQGNSQFRNIETEIRGANDSFLDGNTFNGITEDQWDKQVFIEMKTIPINYSWNEIDSQLLSVPFKQYIKLPLSSSIYNISFLIDAGDGQIISDIYGSSTIYCEMMYIT